MGSNKSLSLPDRLELSHPPLSYSGCLVKLLCPIILIPFNTVDRLRNQFTVSNAIVSKLVSRDLSRLVAMIPQ